MHDGGTWFPSLNQLERFHSPEIQARPNDVVTRGYRMLGDLDIDRLQDAVRHIQGRHLVLTSRIVPNGDDTVLLPEADNWTLQFEEPANSLSAGQTNREKDGELMPPLPTGACVRMALARGAAGENTLRLAADHSVMDARSVSILERDLFAYYSGVGGVIGQTSPWSFGQWTDWERAHIARRGSALASFWRRRLEKIGPFPELGLPQLELTREEDTAPTIFHLTVRDHPRAVLAQIANEQNVSQFSIVSLLIKASVVTLRSITSPCASTTVAAFGAFPNRMPPLVHESIGGFANSAVIASTLNLGDTLGAAVSREAQEIFLASCHQDMPHSLLVKELDPTNYGIRYSGTLDEIPRYFNLDMPTANDETFKLPNGLFVSRVMPTKPELPRSGLRIIAANDNAGWTLEVRHDPRVYAAELMTLLQTIWRTLVGLWLQEPTLAMHDITAFAAEVALRA